VAVSWYPKKRELVETKNTLYWVFFNIPHPPPSPLGEGACVVVRLKNRIRKEVCKRSKWTKNTELSSIRCPLPDIATLIGTGFHMERELEQW
jgi:hypothetical protein